MTVKGTVHLAKGKGPVRAYQVRKLLQEVNRVKSIDVLADVPTIKGRIIGEAVLKKLRTGLTPPTKCIRTPEIPPGCFNLDDSVPEDLDNPLSLCSDLLTSNSHNNRKFRSFTFGHRMRAARARQKYVEPLQSYEDEMAVSAADIEAYDRKVRLQRLRENTALDSEDDGWDEADLV